MPRFTTQEIDVAVPPVALTTEQEAAYTPGEPRRLQTNAVLKAAHADIVALEDGKAAADHGHDNAVADGSAGFMSGADKQKLDGVEENATANAADEDLLDRANHTGTQAISTVDGLQEALDDKLSAASVTLSTATDAFRSSAALFVGTALGFTATQVSRRAVINWVDLAPVSGWTTDATAYAAGVKTLNTAAGASGAVYRGDQLRVGASEEVYTSMTIDTDLSNAGTVTLDRSGLASAVAAAATALTVVKRGQKIYGAINCDNAVEAAIACADPRMRDFELTLGDSIVINTTDAISNIWFTSARDGVPINLHRIEIYLGA